MPTSVNAAVWYVYPFWEIPCPEGCTEGPYVTRRPYIDVDVSKGIEPWYPYKVYPESFPGLPLRPPIWDRSRAARDLLDAGWALDDVLEVLRRADRNGVSYEWNQNDDPDFGNT